MRQNIETSSTRYSEPRIHSSFRFIDTRTDSQSASLQVLFAEMLAHRAPINGLFNPVYEGTAGSHYDAAFFLEQVAHKARISPTDARRAEKEAGKAQFQADAEKLAANVESFGIALKNRFEKTALYNRDQAFTPGLVFDLRDFLVQRIPEWFPIWDCNPFTQYSHEQQVINFKQRTLQHIDCLLIYTYEYFTAWNKLVEEHAAAGQDVSELKVDVYFMMCRALLHDLGRWFTQDARAHEEIPASFAEVLDAQGTVVIPGLRRDLLTLESGKPGSHPREYDVTQPMSLKQVVRIIEFMCDFNSKPHQDFVWETTVPMLLEIQELLQLQQGLAEVNVELSPKEVERLQTLIAQSEKLEHIRTRELRYPELALMYMLYSGRGYKPTSVADIQNWQTILEEELAHNPDKMEYLKTEANMLQTGMMFLATAGLAPSTMRTNVMAKWELLDPNDQDFLHKCFPQLEAQIQAERAAQAHQDIVPVAQGMLGWKRVFKFPHAIAQRVRHRLAA